MPDSPDSFLAPPPLSPGDTVVVLPPTKVIAHEIVQRGVDRLETQFDLDVRVSTLFDRGDEYVRTRPEACAREFEDAFRDPDVGAVFAAIGGDRQLRMTRHLDLETLRANPTRFFGISDNTNLHTALSAAGVVSYYGGQLLPGITTDPELPDYTAEFVRKALFEESIGELRPAATYTDGHFDFDTGEPREWRPNPGWSFEGFDGSVEGRVWGGCIEVLAWILAADRHVPDPADLAGGVLAIETSEELPRAVDVRRWLTTMGERGLLEPFDAVLVGRPKTRHREAKSETERRRYRRDQRDAVRTAVARYAPDAGVVFDVDFGHTDPHVPLPIGGEVAIDPDGRTITCR